MKKLMLVCTAILLAVVVVSPLGYIAYKYNHPGDALFTDINPLDEHPVAAVDFGSPKKRVLEPGGELGVLSCHVIDGYKFKIQLDTGDWIKARLAVVTKEGSTQDVIEWLKSSAPPVVVLKRKVEGCWVVDIRLTIEGKPTMLKGLLEEKGLVL